MFENKKCAQCKLVIPAKVFHVESEADYDGFDIVCGESIASDCEYRNCGQCMSKGVCSSQKKVGYVKPNSACKVFPDVGDYVVFNDEGRIIFCTSDEIGHSIIIEDNN